MKEPMNSSFNLRRPSVNVADINKTIRRALASAGLDTSSGPMHGVIDTIERALSGFSSAPPSDAHDSVIDVDARVVRDERAPAAVPVQGERASATSSAGSFERHAFTNAAGTLTYKVHLPPELVRQAPMIVMLHGCTQSADDFAAGTRMNLLADQHGFIVVYPEQAQQANPSKCWNWFRPQDQRRDRGEPSMIAGIVRHLVSLHDADPRRVFIAGLSAGAAMAVVLGETYPELFAAVGAHSGLPYASAHDIPSALAAMKGGRSGLPGAAKPSVAKTTAAVQAVPLIVFHGDRDHTVQYSNGVEIVGQARRARLAASAQDPLDSATERGTSPGGREYTRTVHVGEGNAFRIESWTVHGGGHAWFGGDPRGSYTEPNGPDASVEMVRFFLTRPRTGAR